MRNLVQYPVTKSEIVECLRKESEVARKRADDLGTIGDMRAYLITKAADVIDSLPDAMVEEKVRIKPVEAGKARADVSDFLSFGS